MRVPKKAAWGLSVAFVGIASLAVALPWDTSGSRSDPLPPLKHVKRRPSDPPKTPRLSEGEAEYLFRRILLKIQEYYVARLGRLGCGTRGPWLSEDRHSEGPKARLFARAYPEVAKRMVLEILEDPEAPVTDRRFALTVLGSLQDWTSIRLEELLRSQVELSDEYTGYFPLWALGRRDREMRHRDLYQHECRRGNSAAFTILSWSYHPTSIPLFEDLARQSRRRCWPLGAIPDEAETALRRIRILQSPDWKKSIEKILRVPSREESEYGYEADFGWAYEVARRRGLPTLLDCLAERARIEPADAERRSDTSDIALTLFAEHGGELTPVEARRLHANGFSGDAEERLLQILDEERIR